jgi:organic hydroperoxide reductase OsmC/OhrA
MGTYDAWISWDRGEQAFVDNRYSRDHVWRFDGGVELPGSASLHVVPAPLASAEAVDPEEAFVAALSSCHMLWFLSIAAKRGYRVDHYRDHAVGVMGKNAEGKLAMTRVTLRPEVAFSGAKLPEADALTKLHHDAHEECFIASSVRSEIRIEPVLVAAVAP